MSLNELRQLRLSQGSRDRAPRSRNKIIKVASLGNAVEVHRKTMDESKENANHYSNDLIQGALGPDTETQNAKPP
jgi:hypothetical protein